MRNTSIKCEGRMTEPRAKIGRAALTRVLRAILRREPSSEEITKFEESTLVGHTMLDLVEAAAKYAVAENGSAQSTDDRAPPQEFDIDYLRQARRIATDYSVPDVIFDLKGMKAFWSTNARAIEKAFLFLKSSNRPTGPYGHTDTAIACASAIQGNSKRIIEIGTGQAIAAIATMCSTLSISGIEFQCLGTKSGRLRQLKNSDPALASINLVTKPIQYSSLNTYLELCSGDILLVDTSHVLSPSSDLHHVLFHILPVLEKGVVVYFTNCRYPLEYAPGILTNRGGNWNEAYALRLLLSNSARYSVKFSGSFFSAEVVPDDFETMQEFLQSPSNGIWIEIMNEPSVHSKEYWPPLTPTHNRKEAAGSTVDVDEKQPNVNFDSADIGKVDLHIRGQQISFEIRNRKDSEIFFSLGVRKSGSTLLHKIVRFLAKANNINSVDIPGTFFSKGLGVADWSKLDLSTLLYPGNLFLGYRSYPSLIAETERFRRSKKVFMHRDPRDAIVSQYFSDAFSHKLPDENLAGGKDQFIAKREKAQASAIDDWVIENASGFARTLSMFKPVLDDPNCLVLPYERYVLEKKNLVAEILRHFEWTLSDQDLESLLKSIDIVPTAENPSKFIRKAIPGDHKSKLTPQTIEKIGVIFKEVDVLFNYN
jgi:hypothetical protein